MIRSLILACLIFPLSGTLLWMAPTTPPTTFISITFDDGLADQELAAGILASHGMRGTFYINSGTIGQPGYLTWDQLEQMQRLGHEIGGHSLTHPKLTDLTGPPLRHEICDDRLALLQHGLRATSFAYSYGQANEETLQVVAQCGYNSGRSVVGKQETLPPGNPYYLYTMDAIQSSTTQADLRRYVKQTERAGGGWAQLIFHHVCEGCSEYSISAREFSSFLQWLSERQYQGTVARTIDEMMGGSVQPAIPAQP